MQLLGAMSLTSDLLDLSHLVQNLSFVISLKKSPVGVWSAPAVALLTKALLSLTTVEFQTLVPQLGSSMKQAD